jgi:hypothetical protein
MNGSYSDIHEPRIIPTTSTPRSLPTPSHKEPLHPPPSPSDFLSQLFPFISVEGRSRRLFAFRPALAWICLIGARVRPPSQERLAAHPPALAHLVNLEPIDYRRGAASIRIYQGEDIDRKHCLHGLGILNSGDRPPIFCLSGSLTKVFQPRINLQSLLVRSLSHPPSNQLQIAP